MMDYSLPKYDKPREWIKASRERNIDWNQIFYARKDNEAGLQDTRGFDVLCGVSFLCHFTNRTREQDLRSEEYLLRISEHRKIIALPEEDTLFLNETRLEEIIDRPYYIFDHGKRIEVPAGK